MFSRKKFKDIKALINLSLVRLKTVRKKKEQELTRVKGLLARHLQNHDFALARLEAERLVKLDWGIEALNMIEIKCEEVRDNVPLLQSQKEVPIDLDEAVSTLIYAHGKDLIPELKEVVRILERKYGQEYIKVQLIDGGKRVDERLIHRLSGQRPNAFLVYNYMKEISATYGIEWVEDEQTKALGQRFDLPMSAGAAGLSSASGIGSAAYAVTDGTILPKGTKPKGFEPPPKPDFVLPSENEATGKGDDGNGSGSNGGAKEVKVVKQPPPAQKKPVAKKNSPKPKPKPVDGGLDDLQARLDRLGDF